VNQAGWNVGLKFSMQGRSVGFFPSVARLDDTLLAALQGLDLLLFDGTLWSNTELIDLGLAKVTGQQMAHMNVGGPDGSLQRLRAAHIARGIYIHINNTNPMLREDSREAGEVRSAGWGIGVDGQEFTL
jgi:pyrroloquinoline quinone biosynthesis protein B